MAFSLRLRVRGESTAPLPRTTTSTLRFRRQAAGILLVHGRCRVQGARVATSDPEMADTVGPGLATGGRPDARSPPQDTARSEPRIYAEALRGIIQAALMVCRRVGQVSRMVNAVTVEVDRRDPDSVRGNALCMAGTGGWQRTHRGQTWPCRVFRFGLGRTAGPEKTAFWGAVVVVVVDRWWT